MLITTKTALITKAARAYCFLAPKPTSAISGTVMGPEEVGSGSLLYGVFGVFPTSMQSFCATPRPLRGPEKVFLVRDGDQQVPG